jgi:cytochrome c-type protein NapB
MKRKIAPSIIFIIVLLMVTFVLVQLSVFGFFSNEPVVTEVINEHHGLIPRQETEAGMYRNLHSDAEIPQASTKKSKRYAKTFYKNRAYMGAPPRIPHSVNEVMTDGGFEDCLQCHLKGSYSIDMKAYAPIAPHPEYTNCRQCHVPQLTKKLFKKTNWEKVAPFKQGRQHLPGSPPVIPHSLQLRENCMSCHFGDGAVQQIKVSHPERTNCRQCHVETNTQKIFKREKK